MQWLVVPAAPELMDHPLAEGFNATVMKIEWKPPLKQNGPDPLYTLSRMVASFSSPPPSVENGHHFTGSGYYMFNHTVVPENSPFTGKNLQYII